VITFIVGSIRGFVVLKMWLKVPRRRNHNTHYIAPYVTAICSLTVFIGKFHFAAGHTFVLDPVLTSYI